MPFRADLDEFVRFGGKGFLIGENRSQVISTALQKNIPFFFDEKYDGKKIYIGNEIDLFVNSRDDVFFVNWVDTNTNQVSFFFESDYHRDKRLRTPLNDLLTSLDIEINFLQSGDCVINRWDNGSCVFSFSFFGERMVSFYAHNYALEKL